MRSPQLPCQRLTDTTFPVSFGVPPSWCIAGVEGAFRQSCELTLRALRSHGEVFVALMQSLLGDPLVNWVPDGAAKEARRAFEAVVELDSFSALDAESTLAQLAEAAAQVEAALAAAEAALAPFDNQFEGAAAAAAALAQSKATLKDCAAAVKQTGVEDARLTGQLESGRAATQQLESSVVAAAAEARACLAECVAWQERHAAVLAALQGTPPPSEVTAAAAVWSPEDAEVPLGLVQAFGRRSTCIMQAALGRPASEAPVSPSLLLQVAAVDTAGLQVLRKVGGPFHRHRLN